jgi:hypothetical protein
MMLGRRGSGGGELAMEMGCAGAAGKKPRAAAASKTQENRWKHVRFIASLDSGKLHAFNAILFGPAFGQADYPFRFPNSASSGMRIATMKLGIVARITQMKKCG